MEVHRATHLECRFSTRYLVAFQQLDFSVRTLPCLLPRKRFVLIGINNNNNTSSPLTSLRLEPVIDVTLLAFNSLMTRPLSSSSVWQTAPPGWIPGPPPAARPFFCLSALQLSVFVIPQQLEKKTQRRATAIS